VSTENSGILWDCLLESVDALAKTKTPRKGMQIL